MADNHDFFRQNLFFLDKTYGEACFDPMFNGIPLSSLLSSSLPPLDDVSHITDLPPDYYSNSNTNTVVDYSSSGLTHPVAETFCFFSEDYPALSSQNHHHQQDHFIDEEALPTLHCFDDVKKGKDFHVSLDESESSPMKRVRRVSSSSYSSSSQTRDETPPAAVVADYTLDAIVRSFKPMIAAGAATGGDSSSKAPAVMSPSEAVAAATAKSKGKNKREKIGEKARCLQELMPWEKKLKMATLLEEAYKYVKFLQAQIKALTLMPFESSFNVRKTFNIGGELGMLNRQELLQVLVNSQAAQTMMYSQDCCVYSIEQYWLIKKITQRRFQLQHHHHV